ncbi:MAG: hypothetical protein E7417_02990 [Ruminococcaceae bacterium]|nr:hypothetical protein [Oscillospiraceae bacterium]
MEYISKASIKDKVRRNYILKIAIVGTISLAGFVLAITNLFSGGVLYAFWYLIAFIIGLSYVVIRINTAFPTYIATDGEKLVLSTWKNCILPYKVKEKPAFISDFIPDGVKCEEISFSDLDRIYVGSLKFLKKSLSEEEYPGSLKSFEEDNQLEKMLKRMDFFLAITTNGEISFMSIVDFDLDAVSSVLDSVERNCQGVKIQIHIPKLLRIRKKQSDSRL